ncbi:hypothetical protein HK097_007037 [Rhizophlyctis rosea]|uniref:Uncharacterized protein n=1 Tax=Rhizophlyctis rosea TaxID=64517 RepID=A0AAD5SIX8_9FUNG|nr:hypothetical protein HK097_007037 [Rhizophlyctis rosea]
MAVAMPVVTVAGAGMVFGGVGCAGVVVGLVALLAWDPTGFRREGRSVGEEWSGWTNEAVKMRNMDLKSGLDGMAAACTPQEKIVKNVKEEEILEEHIAATKHRMTHSFTMTWPRSGTTRARAMSSPAAMTPLMSISIPPKPSQPTQQPSSPLLTPATSPSRPKSHSAPQNPSDLSNTVVAGRAETEMDPGPPFLAKRIVVETPQAPINVDDISKHTPTDPLLQSKSTKPNRTPSRRSSSKRKKRRKK